MGKAVEARIAGAARYQGVHGNAITDRPSAHIGAECLDDARLTGLYDAIRELGMTALVELYEPVNLARVLRLGARLVLRVTGSASAIVFRPLPEDDPRQRRPDITKARALLGWEPKIDLESGLKLSLAYFREALSLEAAATRK